MRALSSVLLLGLLAGCAQTLPGETIKQPRKMEVAGEAVNCVQRHQIRSSVIVDDSTIDFHLANNRIYRNTLPHSCPGLKMADRFAYKTSTNQLCSVDMITVVELGGGPTRGASCGLGAFVPVKAAELAAPATG